MSILRTIFETLREHYRTQAPQAWWPEDPLEVVVGAVLVQGANWKSVAPVLRTLREKDLLDFRRLGMLDDDELATLIRSVGFQTKKSQRLKQLASLFLDRADGDPGVFFARDIETVRRELLTVSGIGPGTADNILLYAGRFPIYMVDPFTTRVLIRHGIIEPLAKESEIQELVHRELTPDEEPYGAKLFGDFQALLVRLGRDFCDKTRPRCNGCPLAEWLPDSGPVGPESHKTAPAPRPRAVQSPAPVPPAEFVPVAELPLSATERKIVEPLSTEPVSIDLLVQTTGLPVHIVRATIAILEMRKIVKQVEGNGVRRIM